MKVALLLPPVLLLAVLTLLGQEAAPTPAAAEGAAAPMLKPKPARARQAKQPAITQPELFASFTARLSSVDEKLHRDFPDVCVDKAGGLWVTYIEHDGIADTLHLTKREGGKLVHQALISQPGVLHQPTITPDGAGGIWCIWGQVNAQDIMTLRARRFTKDGALEDEVELAANATAGASFADAGTDAAGRVWVTWQEVKPGASQIWTRHWSAKETKWSEPVRVSTSKEGGNWEPRLAFTDADADGAWIAYDSSAGSEFNLRLAHVSTAGEVKDRLLLETPEYEARASISGDGKGGLWIAAERGRRQWGLDARGHENAMGFNAQKRLLLGRYDIASETFTEVPVPHNGRPTPAPDPSPGYAMNVPSVCVREGQVWVACRYFTSGMWRGMLLRYTPETKAWSVPAALPDSTMGQDRHQEMSLGPRGGLWMAWPSDKRAGKQCGIAGVYVSAVKTDAELALLPAEPDLVVDRTPEQEPYLNETTPSRPLTEHHEWKVGGKTYRLAWGDLHRHTDISNCRTAFDGCVMEAYRYAYDLAGLDFLGTSDHTDVGKMYDPYEWWHTQRHVDVFHAPGSFASLYAYEREQPFPWGHRNIVFAKRGGPIVYINRAFYRQSQWQETLPIAAGIQPIQPSELWDVLKRYDHPCAVISHTGATNMGTDWTKYTNGIDNTYENTVEIFQGARVSYEGIGAPQPTVGLRKTEPYTPAKREPKNQPMPPGAITDFESGNKNAMAFNNGVSQKALSEGHKLGVFASSDHIATHTSFGGVYVEDFTREGIIAGFKTRRTCAATDKIFVELSCGEHLMGEVFETKEKPALTFRILGNAAIKRVTVVRNEQNYHVIESSSANGKEVSTTWTDAEPLTGENRYYLRIEQTDGNMAWSSPLWVTYGK
jgi:hypothetical protein